MSNDKKKHFWTSLHVVLIVKTRQVGIPIPIPTKYNMKKTYTEDRSKCCPRQTVTAGVLQDVDLITFIFSTEHGSGQILSSRLADGRAYRRFAGELINVMEK